MKNTFCIIGYCGLWLILLACEKKLNSSQPISIQVDNREIDAVIQGHLSRYRVGDIKGYADLFAEDGVMLGANLDPIIGKSNIFAFLSAGYKSGITDFTCKVNSVWAERNLMACDGTWAMSDHKLVNVRGKFLFLLRKESNGWKIFRDIYNEDALPESPAK